MTKVGWTARVRVVRRIVVAASLLAVAPVSLLAHPPAGAATGACPDASGVTVVVDFHELGGGIVVRCAGSSIRSGIDALDRAGFTVAQPLRTPGFVCRIDGKPGADREACVDTPPTSAYWSYWRADRGGDWTYSSQGASTTRPAEVEGWSFALDRSATAVPPPGIAPPPLPSPATTAPKGTGPNPAVGGGTSPGRTHTAGPLVTASVAGVTTTRPGSSPPPSTAPGTTPAHGGAAALDPTTVPTDGSATATTSTERGRVEVATAGATSPSGRDGSGPGAGALAAVVVVAALVAGAVVRSRRRATTGPADGP